MELKLLYFLILLVSIHSHDLSIKRPQQTLSIGRTEKTSSTTTPAATTQKTTVPTPTQEPNESKPSTDLYIYIGGGAAVVALIVAQTACIVSYRRKAANTRRALENILHIREEAKENENERYSQGPVGKKSIPEDEDLYESLDKYVVPAVEGDGGTIKSIDIKNRPPLPLPHEISSGFDRSRKLPRPPIPLPHELPHSEFNAKTLPYKTQTQREFQEKLPEPQMIGTLKSKSKPNLMQSGPGVSLPPRIIPQPGSRDRLPDPPISSVTRPQFRPNPLLKNASPSPVLGKPPCYPPTALQLRNASQLGSHERVPEPPVRAPPAPTPPLRVPHVVSRKQAPENIVNELSKVFAKINPPAQPTYERQNSSDDEWTYEQLPPTNKYLQ